MVKEVEDGSYGGGVEEGRYGDVWKRGDIWVCGGGGIWRVEWKRGVGIWRRKGIRKMRKNILHKI